MAQRKIAIVIELKGGDKAKQKFDAVAASEKKLQQSIAFANAEARKQERHFQQLAIGAAKLTQAQNGLTKSFIKGNLASRAISKAVGNLERLFLFGVKGAASFEFQMAKLSAITSTTGKQLIGLEGTIRKLAAVSPKTATQVSAAALSMAKLGLSADDVGDSLEGVIGLSVALDESVERVGETIVNIKNVFDNEASEMTDISNKLFASFASSALNLEKFSTAFSFAGGTANLAGVEIETLTALMGGLANSGIKASTIGTQLRSVFLDLSDAGSKAGKAIGGETIKSIGIFEALRKLKELRLSPGEIKSIFGKRAVSVVAALTKDVDELERLNRKILETDDVIRKASDTIQDTMTGAVKKAGSAFTDLNISLSKIYSPIVITGLNVVTTLLQGLSLQGVFTLDNLAKSADTMNRAFGAQLPKGLSDLQKQQKSIADDLASDSEDLKQSIKEEENLQQLAHEKEKARLEKIKIAEDERVESLKNILKQLRAIRTEEELRAFGLAGGSREESLQAIQGLGTQAAGLDGKDELLAAAQAEHEIKVQIFENDPETLALKEQISLNEEKLEQLKRTEKAQRLIADDKRDEVKAMEKEFKGRTQLANLQQQTTMNTLSNLTQIGKLAGQNSLAFKAAAILQTTVDTYFGAQLAYSSAQKAWFGNPAAPFIAAGAAALAVGSGLARVAAISSAADGFEGQVNRETFFRAGEAGPEQVSIKPRTDTEDNSTDTGNGINIDLTGATIYGFDDFTDKVNLALENINDKDFV